VQTINRYIARNLFNILIKIVSSCCFTQIDQT